MAEAVMGVQHAVRASPYSSCAARAHDQSSSDARPARHSASARVASDAVPAATAGSGENSAARHSVDPAAATETSANVLSRHYADRAADCANAENVAEPAHAAQASCPTNDCFLAPTPAVAPASTCSSCRRTYRAASVGRQTSWTTARFERAEQEPQPALAAVFVAQMTVSPPRAAPTPSILPTPYSFFLSPDAGGGSPAGACFREGSFGPGAFATLPISVCARYSIQLPSSAVCESAPESTLPRNSSRSESAVVSAFF